jgi:tetratricopeptide (TPR) repeat protein
VIGIVQVGHQAWAERYAYVPLIGIYVGVAWSAGALAARLGPRPIVVCALAALALCAFATRAQLPHWRDSIALFTRAVEIAPESGVTQHNLAVALVDAGRLDEARIHFEKALEVEPRNPRYLNNLGSLLQRAGRPLEAIPYHERAIAAGPRNAVGKRLLGEAHEAAGQLDAAIAAYEAALATRPDMEAARRDLERARARRDAER